MFYFLRKRSEKPPAKKSTKSIKPVLRKGRHVDKCDVETSKIPSTTTRDTQLPKSKQEVFKMFNLSTTNQILQVIYWLGTNNFAGFSTFN